MKTYKRSVKRKRILKYVKIGAAAVLIAAVAIAAIIAYNSSAPSKKPKEPASTYFTFSDLGAEFERVGVNVTNVIKVTSVHMVMTPIKGNATSVHIEAGGYTNPADYWYEKMENGTSTIIDVVLQSPIISTKNGTFFPVKMRIYSNEAEGDVILQIPENNTFATL